MSEKSDPNHVHTQNDFSREIDNKAKRKLKARRDAAPGAWFGLGMMGLIGWSVVVPTLLGTAFGYWLDQLFPAKFSWTLTMLISGLILGCLNAWHWVSKQDKEIHEEPEEIKEDKDE